MSYISSNQNRFYVGLEAAYGQAPATSEFNRIPAVKFTAKQSRARAERKDKTGSRTFAGYPQGARKTTDFELQTYMRDWPDQTKEPGYGPLFHACLGKPAVMASGLTVSSGADPARVGFLSAHGLAIGQAVAYGGDVRFVMAVADDHTIVLNAPFSAQPASGAMLGTTATYSPGPELSSVSIFDCWSPSSSVQRLLYGGAVDQFTMQVNGDYHTFHFSGAAADITDSTSFQAGQAALSAFPSEAALTSFSYSIVPGHLGQLWLGSAPNQFFTLTAANLRLTNNLTLRDREFGFSMAKGVTPGVRAATLDFSLYQQDDSQTQALYQAARQQSPVGVMIQLGQQQGQLAGVYLKGVVLETPEFDDSEPRQQWTFKSCRAQGIGDDEIYIAFA